MMSSLAGSAKPCGRCSLNAGELLVEWSVGVGTVLPPLQMLQMRVGQIDGVGMAELIADMVVGGILSRDEARQPAGV